MEKKSPHSQVQLNSQQQRLDAQEEPAACIFCCNNSCEKKESVPARSFTWKELQSRIGGSRWIRSENWNWFSHTSSYNFHFKEEI
jgi:hypothetical protein